MAKKGPTIKDVAAHAGVSVMAVSRVCNPNGAGQVSEAMRRKVMEAIETLGYRPDTLAQSLRRRRSDTVGFYSNYHGAFVSDDEFGRSIFTGLQDASTELEQDLLIFTVPETPQAPSKIVHELSTSKVDGVIFLPRAGDEELAKLLIASHQNVIAIGEAISGMTSVTAQDIDGSRRLAEHLHSRGHRHVMYRQCGYGLVSGERRAASFRAAADALGMQVTGTRTSSIMDDLDDEERERIRTAQDSNLTAIVGWRDMSAVKAVVYCREIGLRIPTEMAVAGFDALTPFLCPPEINLTTIEVDWARIAKRAVGYVVNGGDFSGPGEPGDVVVHRDGAVEIAIDCPLVIGNTT
ncbi:LacI family transcriptional regulator [Capsulimonas corticalis]|uniref:LacI family transcriptional regulator n=1 Tax=Capsulimonas corticalis TaxID=2219043 RepID=A0A402CVI7_9BACT|nr:LacI family DNA-binding transcriptional regulator [Capsulimonas corticalis]BDI30433.1 LacI family transcriptional regulator [Capsulimonas corticalis]